MIDLAISQLSDPFRIGLIVALVITMLRTSAVTGRVLPLGLGVVFVAVILPTTMQSGTANLNDTIVAGLISNVVILAVVLLIAALVARFRR